jgi:hypothetical protein
MPSLQQSTTESATPTSAPYRPGHLFDLFLSEMSVSNNHGGGLTLQRVLGSDLTRIDKFVHISRFAQAFPPVDYIAGRCIDLPRWLDSDQVRLILGCRPSDWLSSRIPSMRIHALTVRKTISRLFKERIQLTALVCPQGPSAVICVEELKKKFRLDYITWLMDDHTIRFKSGRWRYPAGFRRLMRRHLQDARVVFVISPAMAELYHREFGIRSEVLFAPAQDFLEAVWESPSENQACRIGYFGRVGRWQLDALQKTAMALSPAKGFLDIFSTESGIPEELRCSSIRVLQAVSGNEVAQAMRRYDAVLLPMSFEDEFRNLTELNIATKMSECLGSGTVTLVVGPANAAMVKFLMPTGAAYIVTDPTAAVLSRAITDIRQPLVRRRILTAAKQLVTTELLTAHMRSKWNAALSRLRAEK